MILVALLSIAIFQGIVLGLIILRSPLFRSDANQHLAFAILALSLSLLNLIIDISDIPETSPQYILVDTLDSAYLFPVFIFLFVVHQVGHPIKDSKMNTWLFAPYVYSFIISIWEIFIESIHVITMPSFITNLIGAIDFLIQLCLVIFFVPGVLFYTYRYLQFSDDPDEKRWLTRIWLFILIFFVLWIITLVLGIIAYALIEEDIATPAMRYLSLLVAFFIHWTAYFGVFKFKLAHDQEAIRTLINTRDAKSPTQITAKLSPSQITKNSTVESQTKENIYLKKLESLCANDHIYRDNTLDREKVAAMLGISPGYMSQIINSSTGKNFTTYINHYRVEAVKNLIVDPEFTDYSILAIGLECGFSSKTTFHNSFKKMTGMTPNAYRKVHM